MANLRGVFFILSSVVALWAWESSAHRPGVKEDQLSQSPHHKQYFQKEQDAKQENSKGVANPLTLKEAMLRAQESHPEIIAYEAASYGIDQVKALPLSTLDIRGSAEKEYLSQKLGFNKLNPFLPEGYKITSEAAYDLSCFKYLASMGQLSKRFLNKILAQYRSEGLKRSYGSHTGSGCCAEDS